MTVLVRLLAFGRLLRRGGLDVHVGRMVDLVEALRHVDLGSREDVYHACRALLVHRREDLAAFDRAFEAFWNGRTVPAGADPQHAPRPEPGGAKAGAAPQRAADPVEQETGGLAAGAAPKTWSDIATLARKDLAAFTEEELAAGRKALERLVWEPGRRRTRRWAGGRGAQPDVRRALARSLRTAGEAVVLPRRRRRWRPRPLVLLCDVSGSMDRYSRMLVHFAHALQTTRRAREVFFFSTHLTRVTPVLRGRRLDGAAAAVSRAVPHRSGGTRIGDALRELHQQWGRRILRGGPVVLLISDGWDRGDPRVLREQVARLQRSCHRLIWLNPLIGTAGYAPLTRGLQAALPFVDDFLAARTLADLAELALHLNGLGAVGARGRSAARAL